MQHRKILRCLALAIAVATLLAHPAPAAELIGYYQFEGDYADSTGNGNTGVPLSDATVAPGSVGFTPTGFRGQAIDFVPGGGTPATPTGGGAKVDLPINANIPAFAGPDAVSFGGWANVNPGSDFDGFMATDNGAWDRGIVHGFDGGGWGIASGAQPVASGVVTPNEWQYIAGTFSKSANRTRLYVGDDDPASQVTTLATGSDAAASNGEPTIELGRFDNQDYSGRMDDIFVWNGELTPHEANAIRNLRLSSLDLSPAEAEQLFDIFASSEAGDVGGLTWTPTAGLDTTNPGELVDDGNGQFTLLLDDSGGGLLAVSDLFDPTDVDNGGLGDGMGDNWEIAFFGTTDRDGTDPLSDFDMDGLSDLEEWTRRTLPDNTDTDGDTLEDGAEVYVHGTDPKLRDTDGDDWDDNDEIDLGFRPNDPSHFPVFTVVRTWDFETDDLSGWSIVNTVHGDNAVFATPGNMPTTLPATGFEDATVQGNHFIRTWDGDVLGNNDAPTGIAESEEFTLGKRAKFDFLIGGGNHPFTGDPDVPDVNIAALTLERQLAPGDWEGLFSATGPNANRLDASQWDASEHEGETVRLRIYDTHSAGWGHIDVDDIRYSSIDEPPPPSDIDGDGLSDDDETNVYFTDRFNPDSDGDGQSDGAEVLAAGTNPLDDQSRLELLDFDLVGGEVMLTWSSVPGKSYVVQSTTDHVTWNPLINVDAVGTPAETTTATVDMPGAGETRKWYRIFISSSTP